MNYLSIFMSSVVLILQL